MDSFSFSSLGTKTKTTPSPDRHQLPESGTDHAPVLSHGRSVDILKNTPSSNPGTQDQTSPRKQVLERETRAHTPTSCSDTVTPETDSSQPNYPPKPRSNSATTTNNSGLTSGQIKAGGANEAYLYCSEHTAQYEIWTATGEKNTASPHPQPFSQSNDRPGSTTVLTSKPTRSPDTPSTEQPSRNALASTTCKPKFSNTSPSRHLSHKPNSPTGHTLEPFEQTHRNTEKRPILEAVAGTLPSSSKAVVKAMSPMPKTTAGQIEVAKREQQQPVVIQNYFSDYKGSYDSFKKEHKELCDFMRKRDVLGKANHPDHCKSIFERRGFFEHHLYQMFMVGTSRAALSPLMTRFRSADDLQTKTDIAIEIAEQCIQRSNDTSSHLRANKDSYYEACDPTKTNKEDSPLTVAVVDTPARQFFKEAVRVLRGHQSDAAEVRRFLEQNYDTLDFAFKFDMKKTESNERYRREDGPAEAKEKLLSGFQALIKSGKVINIESGSLKVPAAVAANPEDMACYKTYAHQMFSLHKKVETSLATQDSASLEDTDFLLNICQVALQTMELNDQCAKKQLASQAEKPALR